MSPRNRYRLSPPFPGMGVVADASVIDDYHPLALPLTVSKKYFSRVKKWELAASGGGFTGEGTFQPLATASVPGPSPPIDEVGMVYGQTFNMEIGPPPWIGPFFFLLNPVPNPDLGGNFFFCSRQAQNDFTTPIYAMHQNAAGTIFAPSLIFRIRAGGEISSVNLSSVPGEESGGDVSNLVIDPTGANLNLPLYGRDDVGFLLTLTPAEYWSFGGIYNTTTGEVKPGQRVFQNTFLP